MWSFLVCFLLFRAISAAYGNSQARGQIGAAAADFLAQEKFGNLVAVQNGKIKPVPLDYVAGKVKNIPLDHPMIKTARDLGICLGD